MILSNKQKLLCFMQEKKMSLLDLSHELGYTQKYLSAVMNSDKELPDRLLISINLLFLRYEYHKALDEEGRL